MGEIRIVGPGKTRGYPYPVCKKTGVGMEIQAGNVLINTCIKMPTIVGISTLISRKIAL